MSMPAASTGRCGPRCRRSTQGLARGSAAAATGWLRENVQRHGGLYEPREVIEKACGFEPSEAPLLDYLEAKFGEIYRL